MTSISVMQAKDWQTIYVRTVWFESGKHLNSMFIKFFNIKPLSHHQQHQEVNIAYNIQHLREWRRTKLNQAKSKVYYHQWTTNGRSNPKQKFQKAKKWREEITLNICVHLNESFESIHPTIQHTIQNPKHTMNELSILDALCKKKKNEEKESKIHYLVSNLTLLSRIANIFQWFHINTKCHILAWIWHWFVRLITIL